MNINGYKIAPRADLRWADLSGADLSRADLRWADLEGAKMPPLDVPQGELTGFKKLSNGSIAVLRIAANVDRAASWVGPKLRAASAEVIEGEGESWTSEHDRLTYAPGLTVTPLNGFNNDPRAECAPGVHFFRTREEAEAWS